MESSFKIKQMDGMRTHAGSTLAGTGGVTLKIGAGKITPLSMRRASPDF